MATKYTKNFVGNTMNKYFELTTLRDISKGMAELEFKRIVFNYCIDHKIELKYLLDVSGIIGVTEFLSLTAFDRNPKKVHPICFGSDCIKIESYIYLTHYNNVGSNGHKFELPEEYITPALTRYLNEFTNYTLQIRKLN